MAIESQPIVSLLNGVSQQPASLRHPSQCEAQVNAESSLATGLGKRKPSSHIAEIIATAPSENMFCHLRNRDETERYVVVLTDGDVQVFDLDGVEQTVAVNDATYLDATDPRNDFKCVTLADFTFITNKTVTCAMSGVNNSDSLTGTVQTFSDLPGSPSTGHIYRVRGNQESSFDDYFVKYDGSVWIENHKPGIDDDFDLSTMPHQLVRESNGDFTFGQATWTSREAGDASSAAEPSFIGESVRDIFFYRARLGFLAGEAVVLSRAGTAPGGYFSFWPETVTAVLDSDPIDRPAPNEKVSLLENAVAFDESLIVFAGQTQFAMNATDTLTPSSARIDVTTTFDTAGSARPVALGQNLYFPVDNGDYVGVREYFVESDTTSNDAADVTAHVSQYVPTGIFQLAGSTTQDILVMLTAGATNRIYVYKYFWDVDTKSQAAWSYWEFDSGTDVQWVDFVGDEMYIVAKRSDGVYLEKIGLNSDASNDDLGFIVHLDRRDSLTGVYDSGNDRTTWTLPYDVAIATSMNVVLGASYTDNVGQRVAVTRPSVTTCRAPGDYSVAAAWVGIPYTMSYTFSEQFKRRTLGGKAQSSSTQAVLAGRLQLRQMRVRYVDTGYFATTVSVTGRDDSVRIFTGQVLGDADLLLGSTALDTGTLKFPILSDSRNVTITLSNDSHLASTFLSAEWTGLYSPKSVL